MHRLLHSLRITGALALFCVTTQLMAQVVESATSDANAEGAGAKKRLGTDQVLRIAVPGNLFARLEKSVPTGVFVETMDAILKKMGKSPTYIYMPISDALNDLKDGAIASVAVVVQTPKIKDLAFFSDPIVKEYNVAVTLKNKGFNLSTISDLRGKKVGGRVGYQYPMVEKDKQIQMLRYQSDGEMMRALLFAEIDLALIAGVSDVYTFRSEGVMTRLDVLKTSVGMVPLVAAFSKKHFSKESVAEFNKQLASFIGGEEWQAILESNGQADLVKDWPMLAQ